ncbi:hypothetical protein ACFYQ5_24985 [Streptomyces sp. NPDC005794]|uniref:hypothetical protein n=1 Tax=Streptomyces sp. NPDC005794 TaxID=3364733 RepID=UPI00367AD455
MLAVLDREFTFTLDGHFEQDVELSTLIDGGRWKRRSPVQRMRESAVLPIRRWL